MRSWCVGAGMIKVSKRFSPPPQAHQQRSEENEVAIKRTRKSTRRARRHRAKIALQRLASVYEGLKRSLHTIQETHERKENRHRATGRYFDTGVPDVTIE